MSRPTLHSIVLTRTDYVILESIVRVHAESDPLVGLRAEIIIMSGRGFPANEIAYRLGVGRETIRRVRMHWNEYSHMTFLERLSRNSPALKAKAAAKRRTA